MIKFKIDKIVNDKDGNVVYIHIYEGVTDEVLETASFVWKDKEDFKNRLRNKTKTLRTNYNARKAKEVEVNQALQELETEVE